VATFVEKTKEGKPKTIGIIIDEFLKEHQSLLESKVDLALLIPLMELLHKIKVHLENREKEIELLEKKYDNLDSDLNSFKKEIQRREQAAKIVEIKVISTSPPP
jgi:hypothetical protein